MEKVGGKLDNNYRSANKIFWQTIRRLHNKRTPVATLIKDSEASKVHSKSLKRLLL